MHADASMLVFWNTLYCYAQMEKVETQNLASHSGKSICFQRIHRIRILQWTNRETQNLASLLGGRH